MLLEQLWNSGQGVLSTQVLQELCVNLRRKVSAPLPAEEAPLPFAEMRGDAGRGNAGEGK
jgi:predicted nucleic acid-binding protein